jgi:mRNA-degrading endonuclease RelE of RelBE toxin-antitoxin system
MFTLELSRTSQKALDKLPSHDVKKIVAHLEVIKIDPYRPRETLYRLRVGRLRVEYEVCNSEKVIKIVKIFQKKRKSGYR